MVNYRKWTGLGGCILMLSVVATQFQNCAPAGPVASSVEPSIQSSSLVDTIDDSVTSTELQFNEKSIQVMGDAQDLEAHGSCFEEQNGATLRWELIDQETGIVKDGFVDCLNGSFTVAISNLQQMDCDREYVIEARLGLGRSGRLPMMISCN